MPPGPARGGRALRPPRCSRAPGPATAPAEPLLQRDQPGQASRSRPRRAPSSASRAPRPLLGTRCLAEPSSAVSRRSRSRHPSGCRPRPGPGPPRCRRRAAAAGRRASVAWRARWPCGPPRPAGPAGRADGAARRPDRRRRARLPVIVSSLRSAFSLRLRCFRTPAASSMNARRSSGRAPSTASSWPCPTTTCSLTAYPAVAEQFLDVEQPARRRRSPSTRSRRCGT